MQMSGGGGTGHWCPIDRIQVSEGGWTYTWKKCGTNTITTLHSNDDLTPMGCDDNGNTGSPSCQAADPGGLSLLAPHLQTLAAEPDRILTTGLADDRYLRNFESSDNGLITLEGTNVAKLPDDNRYVRIYRFKVTVPDADDPKALFESSFNLAAEIGEEHWQAESAGRAEVTAAESKHGEQSNYRLLKFVGRGGLVPTLLRPALV